MKIVIDTNIIASAYFFGGTPQELLLHVLEDRVVAVASIEILDEYEKTLDHLSSRLKRQSVSLAPLISKLEIIVPHTSIQACRDKDDNKFLECAYDAKCLYIVSGDKDLLDLGEYQGIQILKARKFLDEKMK
jgi:putative PIN family toxin of toxin-antitoxin system